MISRRTFLQLSALAPLAATSCRRQTGRIPSVADPLELNDIHSRLNPTRVAEVVPVSSLEDLRRLVGRAWKSGRSISVAGGRHSMGGQQFGEDTLHADTGGLNRVLDFDAERGLIRVEGGVQWPQLVQSTVELRRGTARPWAIAQKQTGADRMSIAGSVSANAHGRGLALAPLVGEVESIELVDAGGEVRLLSREVEPELFSLVVGGYGLFGLIYAVTLRLTRRRKLERVVELVRVTALVHQFEQRIDDGFLYGDFQFAIDSASPDFLQRGVFSCYRPVDDDRPVPERRARLRPADWRRLLYLAHTDKTEAFRRYADYYLETTGQLYWSDLHQLSNYDDGYHRILDRRMKSAVAATEMISELYVPPERLADFLLAAAEALRASGADVIYGTVRLIEADTNTFLPWARRRYACVVLNLHVEHSDDGLRRAQGDFQRLIDLALERDGSYFLTYHRWARRDQVLAAYPQMPEFLGRKLEMDPGERFQSDWYRHMREMVKDLS